MYRFVFVAVLAVVVTAFPDPPNDECARLFHRGMRCCKDELNKPHPPMEEFKECFQMHKRPPSCDVDICIATKKGYASDDGTIDKKVLSEIVEQDLESNPTLADIVKTNCVNGDTSKYGMPDMCDLMKFKICREVQMIKNCGEWRDDADCSGIKDLVSQCTAKFE